MVHSVFIDGEAGTTGLQIRQRLEGRRDLKLLQLEPSKRKDLNARTEALNAADVVILCLPDDAARAAIGLIDNAAVTVIDASTAHRTAKDWTYGFPELPGQRDALRVSRRISNPGCYPTGFIALVAPLVRAGLLPPDYPFSLSAVSGYSGGGRALIEEFALEPPGSTADAFRSYGLNLAHKHLGEMTRYAGLLRPPLFAPAVGRYAQGMLVDVPLQLWAVSARPKVGDLRAALAEAYAGERFISVADEAETARLQTLRAGAAGYVAALDPEAANGTNRLMLYVFGNDGAEQARLIAVLDNLGKGASGAAVQNLNLALGLEEDAGL